MKGLGLIGLRIYGKFSLYKELRIRAFDSSVFIVVMEGAE